jgi:hypothetical protein
MIGSEQFTVIRPSTFIFSGTAGTTKVPTTQPPANGCYLRLEGLVAGVAGNVIITGTATDSSATETILSTNFDSDKIAISAKKWTNISNINIAASWVSMVVYPASSSGDKINFGSGSYTSFSILADAYDANLNQFRGYYQQDAGEVAKSFKMLMYDGRYTLLAEDLITIFGKQYKVVDVNSEHGLYSAFLSTMR